ncbi:interleukin-1 receptor type 1-like [Centroberyx affinis]|uniref:interleukin-1 receptor type 1-like n=1 Tax=Centroberyx affinis TaxID=166261 RepID=UPI003A5C3CE8
MDALRFLFLSLAVALQGHTSEGSEKAEPKCKNTEAELLNLTEGEALCFVPYYVARSKENFTDEEFTWYRNDSQVKSISSEEGERIHHHGPALLFLGLSINDSGLYITRRNSSGKCINYSVKIVVFPATQPLGKERLYLSIKAPDRNPRIPCPDPVKKPCKKMNGSLSWYKDLTPLQGEHGDDLRVYNSTTADEGIYTCICTWTHNHRVYKSTASRRLQIGESSDVSPPQIIIPQTNTVHLAAKGSRTTMNCSAFCGKNIADGCNVWWQKNGKSLEGEDGYDLTTRGAIVGLSKQTIITALLTIARVSAQDFQTTFTCVAENSLGRTSASVTLKPPESIAPLVIGAVSVVLLSVLAAAMVKYFAIDLALLFRRYCTLSSRHEDGKVYDAYVVYQTQKGDKALEETLCQFVTNVLPSVLEQKCGYRLFIHGRDDIPGEDRLELVETRVKLSRRLMVILTPGSGSGSEVTDQQRTSPQTPVVGGYDWQVGLHEALVQTEMSVILVQLGAMGPQGYTHLPAGLQHLVRKSAPLRWREDSRGAAMKNSRFWKRVRYMMPATPAKSTPAIV